VKVNAPRSQPPETLPVLTEVVVMPDGSAATEPMPFGAPEMPAPYSMFQPTPQPDTLFMPPAQVNEQVLVERVLHDLERQIDLMFEHRLRESLAPTVTRVTDTLVRELRHELALTLREMVSRAVADELARHRQY
jgi:hypothetical protein